MDATTVSQKKRSTLGKGLEALLGGSQSATAKASAAAQGSLEIALDTIRPGPYQPRDRIDEGDLSSLVDSIRAQGIIQPILVNQLGPEEYEIIAGERRWRAAQLAGLSTIPATVKTVSARAATAMALIENIQRSDLSPMEEARALDRLARDFSLTHQETAEAVGKSRSSVSNLLRLLSLPQTIQRLLEQKFLELGHAKLLLGLKEAEQHRIAEIIAAEGLSVRETEQLLARGNHPQPMPASTATGNTAGFNRTNAQTTVSFQDPNIQHLEQTLAEKLGAKVEVQHHPKGKGRLVIHYHSLEALDGILARIQ